MSVVAAKGLPGGYHASDGGAEMASITIRVVDLDECS